MPRSSLQMLWMILRHWSSSALEPDRYCRTSKSNGQEAWHIQCDGRQHLQVGDGSQEIEGEECWGWWVGQWQWYWNVQVCTTGRPDSYWSTPGSVVIEEIRCHIQWPIRMQARSDVGVIWTADLLWFSLFFITSLVCWLALVFSRLRTILLGCLMPKHGFLYFTPRMAYSYLTFLWTSFTSCATCRTAYFPSIAQTTYPLYPP